MLTFIDYKVFIPNILCRNCRNYNELHQEIHHMCNYSSAVSSYRFKVTGKVVNLCRHKKFGGGRHSSKHTFLKVDIHQNGHSSKWTFIKEDIHLQ